jgi:hypothetical protein
MRARQAAWALSFLLVGTIPAWSQPAPWMDPSAHKATFVTVDDGVQLEVLDWGGSGPSVIRERVEKLYGLQRERVGNHIKWFQRFAERGRVAEISGAHHLFLSHTRDVLQQIDGFMTSPPAMP